MLELSNYMLAFLRERGQTTRSQISAECFRGKVPEAQIDAVPGAPVGQHAVQDQRAVGVTARVARTLVSPRGISCRCLPGFSFRADQSPPSLTG